MRKHTYSTHLQTADQTRQEVVCFSQGLRTVYVCVISTLIWRYVLISWSLNVKPGLIHHKVGIDTGRDQKKKERKRGRKQRVNAGLSTWLKCKSCLVKSLSSSFSLSLPRNKSGGNMLNKILPCVVDGETWFWLCAKYARTHMLNNLSPCYTHHQDQKNTHTKCLNISLCRSHTYVLNLCPAKQLDLTHTHAHARTHAHTVTRLSIEWCSC